MNWKEQLNKFLGFIKIRPFFTAARSFYILEYLYGHFKSSLKWSALDKDNKPIPWYTYPAIDFLNKYDFCDARVFEYGSGNSTLYWAKKCKQIISIEDDLKWFNSIKNKIRTYKNARLMFPKEDYPGSINKVPGKFDIIIIDGSQRPECAKYVLGKLKVGGIVILDNSNWYPKMSKYFIENNLIPVDFFGFAPIIPYISCTSLFIRRNAKLKTLKNNPYKVKGTVNHLLG